MDGTTWWGSVAATLVGLAVGWLVNRAANVLPWMGLAVADAPAVRSWAGRRQAVLAATAVLYLLGWVRFAGKPLALAAFWLYAAYFLAVLVIDLEHRRVLNVMTAPAAAVTLGLAALRGGPGLVSAVLGSLVGLAIFLAVAFLGRGRLGAGDVKLAGVIGLAVGYPHVVSALFLGVVLGGLVAGALLLTRQIGLKSYIAYAPYLCLGALVVLFFTLGS